MKKHVLFLLFILSVFASACTQDNALEEIYESKCAMCHGSSAGRLGPSPVAINTLTVQRIEERLEQAREKDGKNMTTQDKMKASVSQSKASDLAAYIISLKK